MFFNFADSDNLKIFLGDGGSLFLGFLVSATLIGFVENNSTYDPSIVLWFVAVPVFDFFTVIMRRLILKRRVFAADRSHIHHFILSRGFSHFQTTMLILAAALVLLFAGGFVGTYYPRLSLITFVLLFISYFSFRMFAGKAS